jgi:hypothetical protein
MQVFNGTVKFIDLQKITSLQTDAFLLGGAGYYSGDFFHKKVLPPFTIWQAQFYLPHCD